MKRIAALESLRGLLALWVLVGHAVKHAGYSTDNLGPFKYLAQPGIAVEGFIILSGFVIFYLLDREVMSYRNFLARRFFRLAPLFLAVLAICAVTQPLQIAAVEMVPWDSRALRFQLQTHIDTLENFPAHLLAHLTILHGAIDDTLLPNSTYAFAGQAWSISLEWQFYIVAPLIYVLIVQKRWYAIALLIVSIWGLRQFGYGGDGFLLNQAGLFLVGIASFFAYRRMAGFMDHRAAQAAGVAVAALLFFTVKNSASLVIWAVMFAMLVVGKNTSIAQRLFYAIFHHPALLWLGKVSYSIYMVHMLVMFAWSSLLLSIFPSVDQLPFAISLVILCAVTSIAVSAITFHLIERPGMAFAQWISRPSRLPAQPQHAEQR